MAALYTPAQTEKPRLRWPLRLLAAVLAVLIAGITFLSVASTAKLTLDVTTSLREQMATQYLEASVAYLRANRYEQALEYLQAVIDLRPNDPQAQALRGEVYIATGDYDTAMECLLRAQELYGDATPAEVLLQLASLYVLQGDLPSAQPLLERVTQQDPAQSSGWLLLGQIYYEQQDYSHALTCFDAYLEADPTSATALAVRAACRSATGDEPGAMEDLVTAAQYAEDNPEIRIALAEVYTSLGDYAAAADAYALALEADPTNLETYQALSACQVYTGDYAAAVQTCQTALEQMTDEEKAGEAGQLIRFSLAVAQTQTGDYTAAVPLFEELLQQGFETPTVTAQLATCYAMLPDRADEALPLLQSALEADTLTAEERAVLLNQAAGLCLNNGDCAAAADYAAQSLEAVPGGAEALLYRAVANLQLGSTEAALQDLDALLAAQPDLAQVRYYRALAYAQQGRLEEARADLNLCAQDADEPEVAAAAAELLNSL